MKKILGVGLMVLSGLGLLAGGALALSVKTDDVDLDNDILDEMDSELDDYSELVQEDETVTEEKTEDNEVEVTDTEVTE